MGILRALPVPRVVLIESDGFLSSFCEASVICCDVLQWTMLRGDNIVT